MWLVAKYNSKELEIFKKELEKKIKSKVEFYHPKIEVIEKTTPYKKFKYILGQYIFCKNGEFINKSSINFLKNSRGLDYFLEDSIYYQEEIIKFINFCKINEDNKGCLKRSFFNFSVSKKYQFASGPFKNLIFNILSDNQKRFEILLNGKKILVEGSYNNFLSID